MAAPLKAGLDYFPLWVSFFENDKMKILRARYGGDKAAIVVVRLLSKIYAKGYYYKCTADEIFLLSLDMGAEFSPDYIKTVMLGAVERDLFDKHLYTQHEILTSLYVQENYVEATKKRKIDESIERPFWLLSSQKAPVKKEKVNDNSINVGINSINDGINLQSKVNKSKVNKRKIFIVPSMEEVVAYFETEKQKPTQDAIYFADRFWLFYDKKGWRVGSDAMINWRSAATASLRWKDERTNVEHNQNIHPSSIRL